MNQFEYKIINKTSGRINQVHATAKTFEIARLQLILTYGTWNTIAKEPSNIRPAHQVYGELDCSDFPKKDMAWLISEAAKVNQ